MSKSVLFSLAVAAALLGVASKGFAQADECLVEFHDANGTIADKGTLCETATGQSCVFNLMLCVNQPDATCTPATFGKQKFRAKGHCGPVGKLRVQPSGSERVCGTPTGIKVRARGKRPGKCTIRAEVRSGKTQARTDVDKVVLTCMPQTSPCPSTTTSTSTTSTSTTTTTSTTSTTIP
jgi:hypothetical protein